MASLLMRGAGSEAKSGPGNGTSGITNERAGGGPGSGAAIMKV